MRYEFPYIADMRLVEEAIKGREEFIVAERPFGSVVNYMVNFEDSFPPPTTRDEHLNLLYRVRRECRGIKFDPEDRILARPYHKFFNLGERPETIIPAIDFEVPYIILSKLDGSMVHSITMDNQLVYCTKMGITDIAGFASEFAFTHKVVGYNDFCWDLMKEGWTPIFEWCSRKSRIVIDYPSDMLILTGIRHREAGAYKTMFEMQTVAQKYKVPVVGEWQGSYNDIMDLVKKIHEMTDEEGYVFRFPDGHMYKAKNLWYMQIHKTKELLAFEKDVWALVLDDRFDDAKAFMEADDQARIDAFAKDLLTELDKSADDLYWIVVAAKDNLNDSKKRFAIEEAPKHPRTQGLLFRIWDGDDAVLAVREFVRKNVNTGTKLETVRFLANGIRWEDY